MSKKLLFVIMLSLIFVIGYAAGRFSVESPSLITEALAHTSNDCSGFVITGCSYIPPTTMYPKGMYIVKIENTKHRQTFLIKNDRWYPAWEGLAFVLQN